MKNFFKGFEKKAFLVPMLARGAASAAKFVMKNPLKSAMGALTASDIASSAQKASRQVTANKIQRVGPYRY